MTKVSSGSNQANNGVPTNQSGISREEAIALSSAPTEDRIPKATAQTNCFSACFAGILGLFNSTSRNFNLDNAVSVSAQLTNDSTNNQVTTVSSSPDARVQLNRVAGEVIAIGSNTSRTIFV